MGLSSMRSRLYSLLFAMLCCAAAPVSAQQDAALAPIPRLDVPVIDVTGTLSVRDRQRLEARASELRRRSGAQLQILIVPTTAPEDVADYAQRVFDTQGLGRRGVDDGLLIVVAKNDRRMRIHVGTGLEANIPDATAKRLIDEYLTPKFRRGDFAGGLDDATSVLASLVNGEPLPNPSPSFDYKVDASWALLGMVLAVLVASLVRFYWKRLPRLEAFALTVAIVGVVVGLISMSFIVALVCAVIAAAIDFLFGMLTEVAAGPSPPPREPSPQWNPDELTFDPNDRKAVRRRAAREREAARKARKDSGGSWSGGGGGGGGGSSGGGGSGGW